MKIVPYVLGLLVGLRLLASNDNHLDQISLNEGLSQSEVRAILQDSKGYLWFGTQDGLNRYDGYEIRQFHNDPFDKQTLPNGEITFLYEDSRQNVWVGTLQGICVYDRLHDRFIRYTHLLGKVQSSWTAYITSITEDSWKTIWMGTPLGLWRFIPNPEAPLGYITVFYGTGQGLTHNRVIALHTDAKNNVWVATAAGLNRLVLEQPEPDPRQQRIVFENASNHPAAVYQKLSMPIQRLVSTKEHLWASSDNRLFAVSLSDLSVQDMCRQLKEADATITALQIDQKGVLWIGTFGSGLFRYQLQPRGQLQLLEHMTEERSQPNGLKSGTIYAIYEGKDVNEDIVWLGTREAGVHLYSRSKNSFHQWGNLLSDDRRAMEASVFSICTDGFGYLWVGTFQGLFQIDRQTQKFKKIILDKTNPRNNVHLALLEDRNRNFWVGSSGGLYRYDRSRDAFRQVLLPVVRGRRQPAVKHLFEDKAGNLWIATYAYLLVIKHKSAEKQLVRTLVQGTDTLTLEGISTIKEDEDGNLWIGTDNGLVKWQPQTGKFRRYVNDPENPKSLIGNNILNIHQDKRNQLWICSSKGLSKLVKAGGSAQFVHYTRQHGLPNTFVYGALSDKTGKLWISTNAGLSCFDPQRNTFKNYDTNDGLSNREFNSGAFHQSREGELFFGGQGVLVSFFPDRLIENKHLPKVNISSFQYFQKKISLDSILIGQGRLQMRYKDFFSFFFSATDYSNPARNRFAYKLEGLQDHWIYTENRFFGIADVKPGKYVLTVKSSNNQGHWNEKDILRIPIEITPPFWLSDWFYVLIGVSVSLIGFSLYRYRVRRKVERALTLERIKIEENERVRKLAAQDLHDEFGNGLTRIAVLTELIKHKLDTDVTDARYLLGKINDNAQRLYQGTKDFIWTINPEHDNFYEIALRLKDFGDDIFEKTLTRFNVAGIEETYQTIGFPMGASRHLIMIFKEAMSNTLKYANASQGLLSFDYRQETISIRWQDNGKGFDTAMATQSHGLVNMRARADKIGGNVTIESKTDSGTEVIFEIKSPKLGETRNPVF